VTSDSTAVIGPWTARAGERYRLGEGSRLVDGRLVMVDIPTGRLLEAQTGAVLVELDEPLGAVAPLVGGGWLAAAGPGFAVLRAGRVEWLARPEDVAPVAMRMNDAVADPAGRFWAGSMAAAEGSAAAEGAGSLYRVDPDGSVHAVLDGLTIPNGPAFDADGTTMYLAESTRGIINRATVDPATGELGPLEVFARVEGGAPDGMTVDADGVLWSAVHGGGRLDRYRPDGTVLERIPLPARQPTSVCLTAEPPYLAVVTSGTDGLADPGPDDGAVLVAPVTAAGRPAAVARAGR
jgi:sugar lactone lactonase YvrE